MAIEQVKPSEKQIKGQVRDVADRGEDISRIEGKDPNFAYRWINTHKQNLATKKSRGWEVVSDMKIKSFSGTPDSTHQIGDLVLARMPKDKYEKMMKAKSDLDQNRRKAVKQSYVAEGRQSDGKNLTFDERG
jgi:hypothetical protein